MRKHLLVRTPLVLLVPLLLAAPCGSGIPAPSPGAPEFQQLAFVRVPGGAVNVAGGNLLVARTDVVLDTRLGPYAVGATYNSASGEWLFGFDITYDGETFVDATGAVHGVGAVSLGAALPGTGWVKLDIDSMKTKGGLVHDFGPSGRLEAIHWSSADDPHLAFTSETVAGELRITAIDQCTGPTSCTALFTIEYDATASIDRIVDRTGRVAEFDHDTETGVLLAARDALDLAEGWLGFRYEYEGSRLTALTNSEEERIEFGYAGARLKQVKRIGEGDPHTTFSYRAPGGSTGFETRVENALGQSSSFRWDGGRRVLSIENGAQEITLVEWTANRPAALTRPDGVRTEWLIQDDDPVRIDLPTGNSITLSYDASAENRRAPMQRASLLVTDLIGVIVEQGYDALGRLASISNGTGDTIQFTHTLNGEIATVTEPSGVVTQYSGRGEHGWPTQVERAGITELRSYDAVGNLLTGSSHRPDAPGFVGAGARSWDDDRNLASVVLQSQSGVTVVAEDTLLIEYRSDHRRTRILRPYGADAEFVYDSLGRLVERRDFFDGSWRSRVFERDPLDRVTRFLRPNGMERRAGYDAAGRPATASVVTDGVVESSVVWTYVDGRVTQLLDSVHGAPETFAYGASGLVESIVYPDGETVTRSYDSRGHVEQEAYWLAGAGGLLKTLDFDRDAAGRVTQVRDDGAMIVDRAFAAGRLTSTAYGNGLVRTYEHLDPAGRLTGTTTVDGLGATVETATLDWTSNFFAQVVATTETYASLPELTTEFHTFAPTGPGARVWASSSDAELLDQRFYAYDESGNLTSISDGGGSDALVYDTEHVLLQELRDAGGAPLHTYLYDEAGFVIDRDGETIAWNGAGRVAAVGAAASFVWDTLGRPVSGSIGSSTRTFLYGGRWEADAVGNPLALDLGEVRIDAVTGDRTYRHFDFRGNVKFVSDETGMILAHHGYTSYGPASSVGGEASPRGFAGGAVTGDLVVLGSRLYDPAVGRFLSPDPRHQLVNQFTYTLGDPVHFWDPDGESATTVEGAIGLTGVLVTGIGGGLLAIGVAPFAAGIIVTIGVGLIVGSFVDPSAVSGWFAGSSAGIAGVVRGIGGMGLGGFTLGFSLAQLAQLVFEEPGLVVWDPPDPGTEPQPPGQMKVLELEVDRSAEVAPPACSALGSAPPPDLARWLFLLVPLQILLGVLLLSRRS